jgi:carbon storage regulator CsrA
VLVFARTSGEAIRIGDSIRIVVTDLRSGRVRIGIEAPEELSIVREELYEEQNTSGVSETDDGEIEPADWLRGDTATANCNGEDPRRLDANSHDEEATMAKCHYSGVELPLDRMMKLDIPHAKAKLHELRTRLNKLEEVVEELSETDTHVVEDYETGEDREVERYRLISEHMAEVLSEQCGVDDLFEPFMEWLEQKRESQERHQEYHDE